MDVIESNIETSSKDFMENYKHYEKLVADLKEKISIAQKGGGDEKIKLHCYSPPALLICLLRT